MTCKQHRNGGKFHGKHTTYIDTAAKIADHAVKLDEVTRVSPGIIKSGIGNCGGQRRVKISNITCGQAKHSVGILLTVRENGGAQEVYVCSHDMQKTKLSIAKYAQKNNIYVNLGKA